MAKRKAVDKWKKKEWYTTYSPKSFDEKEVCLTPADDEKKLINRVIRVPLREITHNVSHQSIKLLFRINEVKGDRAYTELDGFVLTREYLRRNIRRRASLVETVSDLTTRDKKKIRVTAYAFTVRKVDTTKKKEIRKVMLDVLEKKAKENSFGSLVQKSVFGGVQTEIFKASKKISPIRRIEISKCVVLRGK